MIDIHNHLLPGVDDGAESLAEALDMARLAAADGLRRVVCSPHVYDGHLANGQDLASLGGRVQELVDALKRQNIPLELDFWAEIWLTPEVLDDIDRLPIVGPSGESSATGARAALIEFGLNETPSQLEEYFFRLLAQDITPVIAHPERVHAVARDPAIAVGWAEQGCLLQVNAGSLTGLFGQNAQKTAGELLLRGVVHFLGTDAHSATGRRPELSRAVAMAARLVGEENARRLVTANPEALLGGAQVEPVAAGGRAADGNRHGQNQANAVFRWLERLQSGLESRRNRRSGAAR